MPHEFELGPETDPIAFNNWLQNIPLPSELEIQDYIYIYTQREATDQQEQEIRAYAWKQLCESVKGERDDIDSIGCSTGLKEADDRDFDLPKALMKSGLELSDDWMDDFAISMDVTMGKFLLLHIQIQVFDALFFKAVQLLVDGKIGCGLKVFKRTDAKSCMFIYTPDYFSESEIGAIGNTIGHNLFKGAKKMAAMYYKTSLYSIFGVDSRNCKRLGLAGGSRFKYELDHVSPDDESSESPFED